MLKCEISGNYNHFYIHWDHLLGGLLFSQTSFLHVIFYSVQSFPAAPHLQNVRLLQGQPKNSLEFQTNSSVDQPVRLPVSRLQSNYWNPCPGSFYITSAVQALWNLTLRWGFHLFSLSLCTHMKEPYQSVDDLPMFSCTSIFSLAFSACVLPFFDTLGKFWIYLVNLWLLAHTRGSFGWASSCGILISITWEHNPTEHDVHWSVRLTSWPITF